MENGNEENAGTCVEFLRGTGLAAVRFCVAWDDLGRGLGQFFTVWGRIFDAFVWRIFLKHSAAVSYERKHNTSPISLRHAPISCG